MIKTLSTFSLSLGLALTVGCSSSSDEPAEAPAAPAAPNFAAIHADDTGDKFP